MMAQRSTNTAFYLMVSGLLILIFCLTWGARSWASFRNYGTLTDITISRTHILPVETYLELMDEWIDTPLRNIDLKSIQRKLQEHPYVWVSRVSRKHPETLVVEMVERIPLGMVNLEKPVIIDLMGTVLPEIPEARLDVMPVLSNFNPSRELYPIGKPVISTKVIEARNILFTIWETYRPLYMNLSEVRLNIQDEFELILAEEPTRIILGTDEIGPKLAVLKEFQEALQPRKLTDYSMIDLRYRNQIVTRERRG